MSDTVLEGEENGLSRCAHPPHPVDGADGLPGKDLHNRGCPALNPADQAEWNRGHADGFNEEEFLGSSQLRHHKLAYQLGWRVGRAEIDGLIDDAAQARYFG